jgi:solute carrier family 13 (sodium-dependent dicarboxylate transporter), member 2/3/5
MLDDTRREMARLLRGLEFNSGRAVLKFAACALAAGLAAWLPEHAGLGEAGRWALAIVLLGAGLWITEAIPAFAVALLVIGLQIIVLGREGGVLAAAGDSKAWEAYVRPWASPPMWLFFGGLVLARAAERTGLDREVASRVIAWSDGRPSRLLPAVMALAFGFSMFMSNTATAAMMLAMLRPALAALPEGSRTARALLLGLACAANLGGMATIIGTPPNAIAAALLEDSAKVDFLRWSLLAAPPALLLFGVLWAVLAWPLRAERGARLALSPASEAASEAGRVRRWQRHATLVVFLLTVVLWMSGAWHGASTGVVSFVPIVALSMMGVIRRQDIRAIDWDVLILLAGGLSLGVGIEQSGLAEWLAGRVGGAELPAWQAALALAGLAALVSNLMSNTAAANILLPVTLVIARAMGGGPGAEAAFLVPVALACSTAMALPISTPPNAIVYASGRLRGTDYLLPGLLMLVIGPPLTVAWCRFAG